MSDDLILIIGVVVFLLMFTAIMLTIIEFRSMPRRQKPRYKSVAFQAQPEPRKGDEKSE